MARLTEPVARIVVLALYNEPLADTVGPLGTRGTSPSIISTLFFLSSPATPPVKVETTWLRRSRTREKSIFGAPTVIPNSDSSAISEATSATRRTALAGMHA